MHGLGAGMVRYVSALTLTTALTVACYAVTLNGEMCSTMVSVNDGENLTTLQEKAFAKFKLTCRNSESGPALNDATPCYGPFTTGSGNPRNRYPQDGSFDHPLERLEFSVKSTNNVFLDLKDASNNMIVIELGSTSRIETAQARQPGSQYVNLSDVTRFWVTHIDGKIQVGVSGEEAPFMENNNSNMEAIEYIIYDSDAVAEWLIYMPCNTV